MSSKTYVRTRLVRFGVRAYRLSRDAADLLNLMTPAEAREFQEVVQEVADAEIELYFKLRKAVSTCGKK